jgi:hypothetical protein
MKSRAWQAMPHGARSLHIALKARWSFNDNNNGHLFMSQRDASIELGSKLINFGAAGEQS